MKVYADPLLAETVPDGRFGGARRLAADEPEPPRPDPNAARHLAELAAAVAEIDEEHGYGVHLCYRHTKETAA